MTREEWLDELATELDPDEMFDFGGIMIPRKTWDMLREVVEIQVEQKLAEERKEMLGNIKCQCSIDVRGVVPGTICLICNGVQ